MLSASAVAQVKLDASATMIDKQAKALKLLTIGFVTLLAVDVAATGLAAYEGGRAAGWWK